MHEEIALLMVLTLMACVATATAADVTVYVFTQEGRRGFADPDLKARQTSVEHLMEALTEKGKDTAADHRIVVSMRISER